jgi:hypothetical protein
MRCDFLCVFVAFRFKKRNEYTIFTDIRQLEFAILQMQNDIQYFMMGIECIFLGKLSINLIRPTTLYSVLRNVSTLLR